MKTTIKSFIWHSTFNWCTSKRKLLFFDRWVRDFLCGIWYWGYTPRRSFENATLMIFVRYDQKHKANITERAVDFLEYGCRWFCPKCIKLLRDEGFTWLEIMKMPGNERKEIFLKSWRFPSQEDLPDATVALSEAKGLNALGGFTEREYRKNE